ncbi:Uncharacterised protein [Kluyvera cryocrescens]|uniref:Uncharacterized protein n=1 Tax=Kluyvera cryocrescens TaxID=580 RepID=A0A485AA17_KLUCR|nr:Uncharacterised protein [Kluyvera cryocrescens]
MRFAFGELLHMHQRQHFIHAGSDFGFWQFVLLEAKGNILFDGHMREERIRLEHHINRA